MNRNDVMEVIVIMNKIFNLVAAEIYKPPEFREQLWSVRVVP